MVVGDNELTATKKSRRINGNCDFQLELESSAKFLAIKRCQGTKIGKVIKLARSSILSGPIWAHR